MLDLGTGTGVLPRNMYEYGADFVGTDISENQIKFAKILAQEKNQNIQFLTSSAEEIPFERELIVITGFEERVCEIFIVGKKEVSEPSVPTPKPEPEPEPEPDSEEQNQNTVKDDTGAGKRSSILSTVALWIVIAVSVLLTAGVIVLVIRDKK